jgi:hypothetical protein
VSPGGLIRPLPGGRISLLLRGMTLLLILVEILSFDYSLNFDCCFMLLFLVMVHCWDFVVFSNSVGG